MTAPSPLISRWNVTFDKNLELRPDSAPAITGGTTTTEPSPVLDLGDGVWFGLWVIDVQAITTTATSVITIALQGSNSSSFNTTLPNYVRELAVLRLGDVASFAESADSKLGRYKMPVWNVKMDEYCRYVRIQTITTGTGALDFRSYLGSSTQSF